MTTSTLRRRLLALLPALAATPLVAPLLAPLTAHADAWPDKPVKLLVGFPPGTGPDVVTRLLGAKLAEGLKQQVVVDNRAGAGGQIAAQAVAKGAADGYTLLVGEVGSISIAPAAFSKLPYDPVKELVGISELVRSDFVLVVPANSPSTTLADFLKAAKAKGGGAGADRVNLATFGAGTPGHFGAELLGEAGGFRVEPIHYRATGDAVTAIVAGDVSGAFVTTALASVQIKAGKMRALATTAAARSPQLPEVPTFAEAGLAKLDFAAWFGLFAPAGTPAPVLDQLNRQVAAALADPATRSKLQEAGFRIVASSRADTDKLLRAEATRWAAAVKASGFKGD